METPPAPSDMKASLRFTAIMVAVHAVLWIALAFCMVFVVPRFQRIFREFEMPLPWSTQILLSIADWLVNYWYILGLMVPPLLVMDAAVIYLPRLNPRTRTLSNLWSALILALLVLIFLFGVVALWIPLVQDVGNLSK